MSAGYRTDYPSILGSRGSGDDSARVRTGVEAMPQLPSLKTLGLAAALLAVASASAPAENSARPVAPYPPVNAGVKPWPAPTGHRQPHAGDIPPGTGEEADIGEQQLEAEVDRKLRICRGC
jgi:hypothetical protein